MTRKVSNTSMSLIATLGHIAYCLQPSPRGSRGPAADILSALVKIFIPLTRQQRASPSHPVTIIGLEEQRRTRKPLHELVQNMFQAPQSILIRCLF